MATMAATAPHTPPRRALPMPLTSPSLSPRSPSLLHSSHTNSSPPALASPTRTFKVVSHRQSFPTSLPLPDSPPPPPHTSSTSEITAPATKSLAPTSVTRPSPSPPPPVSYSSYTRQRKRSVISQDHDEKEVVSAGVITSSKSGEGYSEYVLGDFMPYDGRLKPLPPLTQHQPGLRDRQRSNTHSNTNTVSDNNVAVTSVGPAGSSTTITPLDGPSAGAGYAMGQRRSSDGSPAVSSSVTASKNLHPSSTRRAVPQLYPHQHHHHHQHRKSSLDTHAHHHQLPQRISEHGTPPLDTPSTRLPPLPPLHFRSPSPSDFASTNTKTPATANSNHYAHSRRTSIVDGILVTASSPSSSREAFSFHRSPFTPGSGSGSVGLGLVNSQSEILDLHALGISLDALPDTKPSSYTNFTSNQNQNPYPTSYARQPQERAAAAVIPRSVSEGTVGLRDRSSRNYGTLNGPSALPLLFDQLVPLPPTTLTKDRQRRPSGPRTSPRQSGQGFVSKPLPVSEKRNHIALQIVPPPPTESLPSSLPPPSVTPTTSDSSSIATVTSNFTPSGSTLTATAMATVTVTQTPTISSPQPTPLTRRTLRPTLSSPAIPGVSQVSRPSPPIPARNPLRSRATQANLKANVGLFHTEQQEMPGSKARESVMSDRTVILSSHSHGNDVHTSGPNSARSDMTIDRDLPTPRSTSNRGLRPDSDIERDRERIKKLPDIPTIGLSTPTKSKVPLASTMPPRSPSMPIISVAGHRRLSGNTDATAIHESNGSLGPSPTPSGQFRSQIQAQVHSQAQAQAHSRSRSHPANPFYGSARSSQVSLPNTPRLSKRAHLIQEICMTERSYARDLELVRDAYLYRIRPVSQQSNVSSQLSPGGLSTTSKTSVFTFETAETSSTSLQDNPIYVGEKSGGFTDTPVSEKNDEDKTVEYPEARIPLRTTSTSVIPKDKGFSLPPVPPRAMTGDVFGALSATDTKTIFINIEQLASFSHELAETFDRMSGDGTGREVDFPEEGGKTDIETDALGEAFLAVVSQMISLYTTYCARQSGANARLLELMSSPASATYLNECWKSVQPHTNAWDLGSMLIKPVQRVMKYHMLFADLLANTSPAHPDYFNLRHAADAARSVADKVNEVKRRKDVVEKVISGSSKRRDTPTLAKESKLLKLGKRFRKDKDSAAPVLAAHATISVVDAETLKGLVERLEQGDQVVRRVGKDINGFSDRVRDTWVSQRAIAETWGYVIRLDDTDPADERIEMFKAVSDEIMNGPWRALHEEIRNSIMPVFSTLLRLAVNPKALVNRMESRRHDYMRVQMASGKSDMKNLDNTVLAGADDYIAIHGQLLEELPSYIRGYTKILDAAVATFAGAQAKFHESVKSRLQVYVTTWAVGAGFSGDSGVSDSSAVEFQSMTGANIVKNWFKSWKSVNEQIEGLACVQPPLHRPVSTSSSLANMSRNISRHGSRNSINNMLTEGGPSPVPHRSRSSSLMNPFKKPTIAESHSPQSSRPTSSIFDVEKSSETGDSGLAFGSADRPQKPNRPRSFLPPVASTGSLNIPGLLQSPNTSTIPISSPPLDQGPPVDGLPPSYVKTMWAAAATIYQCKCVAEFQLDFKLFYAGLLFLNMSENDVLE